MNFHCSQCSYATEYKRNLKKHEFVHINKPKKCLKNNNSQNQLVCSICNFSTKNSALLKRHEMNHVKNKKHKCMKCDFSSNYLSYLKAHMVVHSSERPFKCSVCSFASKLKSNLKKHEKTHNISRSSPTPKPKSTNRPEDELNCSLCTYTTTKKYLFNRHLNRHKKRHMKEAFEDPDALAEDDSNSKLFKCYKCFFSTKFGSTIQKHELIHRKTEYLDCLDCKKTPNGLRNFKEHMKLHIKETEPKNLSFNFKDNSFFDESVENSSWESLPLCNDDLSQDQINIDCANYDSEPSPEPSKPASCNMYICSKCPYSSSSKYFLQKHEQSHFKPFKCSKCVKAFNREQYLRKHERSHDIHDNDKVIGHTTPTEKENKSYVNATHNSPSCLPVAGSDTFKYVEQSNNELPRLQSQVSNNTEFNSEFCEQVASLEDYMQFSTEEIIKVRNAEIPVPVAQSLGNLKQEFRENFNKEPVNADQFISNLKKEFSETYVDARNSVHSEELVSSLKEQDLNNHSQEKHFSEWRNDLHVEKYPKQYVQAVEQIENMKTGNGEGHNANEPSYQDEITSNLNRECDNVCISVTSSSELIQNDPANLNECHSSSTVPYCQSLPAEAEYVTCNMAVDQLSIPNKLLEFSQFCDNNFESLELHLSADRKSLCTESRDIGSCHLEVQTAEQNKIPPSPLADNNEAPYEADDKRYQDQELAMSHQSS